MKKWKCTVCGYIHTGDEPPEKCPICGADKSKFEEVMEETPDASEPDQPAAFSKAALDTPPPSKAASDLARYYNLATDLMMKHHAHPISVHVPNGVLPMSVLFVILAALFHSGKLELAAICNMVYVLLMMPLVLFTGYNEWKKKYKAARTDLFLTKIACGGVVLLTALVIIICWIVNPDIASAPESIRWIFVLLNLIMLAAAGLAGYLGGKLVFKD